MKLSKSNRFLGASVAGTVFAALFFSSQHLGAATVYKAGNDDNLNLLSSWWTTHTGTTNPGSIGTTDTLWFGGTGQAASRTLSLGGNLAVGALRLDNVSGSLNYNVTINSGNTLTLNGNNDYNAGYLSGIVLNSGAGGSLIINSDVNVGNSQKWVASRNLTVGGAVNLNASTLSFFSAGGTTTVSGEISGTGSLTRTDSNGGAVVISGLANTYTGTTTTGLGTLQIYKLADGGLTSSIGQSTNAAANLVISAGTTLSLTGNSGVNTTDRLFTLSGAASTYTVSNNNTTAANTLSFTNTGSIEFIGANAHTFRLAGTNTGANSFASTIANFGVNLTGFTKIDAGSWSLTNTANTYTGVTTLSGGNLFVTKLANGGTASSIGGSTSAAANLVFNGGALNYTGAGDSTDRAFTISSSPTINASGSGALTWSGVSPTFTTANTAYTITLGGTSTANNSWGTILANNGSGAISLSKSGIGTWVSNGAHTYTGATTVSAGTLKAGVASVAGVSGAFGNNSAVTLANVAAANLDLNGFNTQIGSLTGGGTTGGNLILGENTLIIGGNDTSPAAYAGAISGTNGAITKIGNGALTLSGNNTYTGETTVSAGTLTLGSTTAIGTGALTITGGSLNSSVANLVNANNNTQNWNGDFTFTGTQNLNLGTGAVALSATRQVTVSANTLTVGGAISGSTFGLTKAGVGTLALSGTNTYTGATTLTAGTLSVEATSNLGDATSNLVFNGGTLQITGTTLSNFSGIGHTVSFTATKLVSLDINNAAHTFTVDQVLNQTTGGFTKLGEGTAILNQPNTYTGSTFINQGILTVTGSGVLGGASGSTADAGNIVFGLSLNSGTLNFETAANLGAAGQIRFRNTGGVAGSGGLLKYIGTTAQTVSKSIQCDTTIGIRLSSDSVGGSVEFSGSWTASSSSRPVYLGGTGTGANTISGVIIGSTLTKVDAGTWTLSGANSYAGATTVSAGVLNIQNNTATGTTAGGVSVTGGAALQIQNGITVGNEALALDGTGVTSDGALRNISGANVWMGTVTLNGATRINSDAGSLTFNTASNSITGTDQNLTLGGAAGGTVAGTITIGTGTLTKDGAGTWVLNGANTFTGGTTISVGTLQLGNGGATGSLSTTGVITNNGNLTINRNNAVRSVWKTKLNNLHCGTSHCCQTRSW